MNRKQFLSLIPATCAGIFAHSCGSGGNTIRAGLPERGLCAHRGAMDTHPENTLAAFREAIDAGAHMIELDAYLTKDSHLAVIHDSTVDRTTDGTGEVSDFTLAEIQKLDAGSWKSPKFEGERIPSLHEALGIMPSNIWLNVHLKGGKTLGVKAARMIVRENRQRQAFLACGKDAAEGARAVVPDILICNMDRQKSSWDYVNETIAMKANFIQLLKPISPEFPEYTRKLTENGVRINYFGTDSPEELYELFNTGVQFPLVNSIVSTMQAVKKMGIYPVKREF